MLNIIYIVKEVNMALFEVIQLQANHSNYRFSAKNMNKCPQQ
jgi:hypothetical protein